MFKGSVALSFKNRVYAVRPGFSLVREIEQELGGLPALAEKFSHAAWRVSDLVALIQMMLQSAGETVDYLLLGETVLKEGPAPYLRAARDFLQLALQPE